VAERMNTPNKQAELEKEIELRINKEWYEMKQYPKQLIRIDYGFFEMNDAEIKWKMLKGIKEGKAQAISEFKETLIKLAKIRTEKDDYGFTIMEIPLEVLEATARQIMGVAE
jgi:hypothetical protein